jgi:hypothetical protein
VLQEASHDADDPDMVCEPRDAGQQAAMPRTIRSICHTARDASISRSMMTLSVRELILTPI